MGSLLNFWETYFFGLPSQSNVYGLSTLCSADSAKLLVATLKRQVFTVEYSKSSGFLLPAAKEVQFTYIPSDANIISVDVFNKSEESNDFVVGITFIKNAENQVNYQYFNIYFDWEPGAEFNLDTISQSCTSVPLNFIPYILYHTKLVNSKEEVVWLLSGSDCQIHLYREDKVMHKFVDQPVADIFPEFSVIPSIVLTLDTINFEKVRRRISTYGCENGIISISVVDIDSRVVLSNYKNCHDGPITSLQLFMFKSNIKCPVFLRDEGSDTTIDGCDITDLNLLVTTALEETVVYLNIFEKGFDNQVVLPDSNSYDSVLCSCIDDIDMDGYNEILLGTYGQELLIYKASFDSSDDEPSNSSMKKNIVSEFMLVKQRSFSSPIHAIKYIDITGDGLQELVVLSLRGVHILQHSLKDVAELCESRLQKLVDKRKHE